MIKKFLLAAVLTCGLNTTYAAERPLQFASLHPTSIATACALQMGKFAYEIKAGTVLDPESKMNGIRSLLELHLVWARLAGDDEEEVKRLSTQIKAQDANTRVATNNYCSQEGQKMFDVLSAESKNRIRSQAIDLQIEVSR